ncbi:MAG TPA: LacI family DNA-binding transcriptional regulator, partial [Propionibacteriaceae bacterium]
AAAELGYSPSATARALSSGRSEVVLLLLPDWPIGTTVGRMLVGLSGALASSGLTLVAHPLVKDRPASAVWRSITPAAVITFEDLDDVETTKLRAAGIELTVTLLGDRGRPGTALIAEQRAGRLQAEHLAFTGHRRLGYAWPHDDRLLAFAEPRLEGARQACAELGLAPPTVLTVPLDPDEAKYAVARWREGNDPVTGVCAYDDEVAMAVLAGAHRLGLKVPHDLAVIGVDDTPIAAISRPPLTTVDTDTEALAQFIADTVVNQLAGQPTPRRPGSNIHSVIRRKSA